MGEFEFIERVRRAFREVGDGGNGRGAAAGRSGLNRSSGSERNDDDGYLGIGDDCAVFPLPGGEEAFVMTTDMLVEGVHFLREAGSARELGAKALAVNLSDVAAMGARPVASLLSLALPAECRGDANGNGWADEFMEGYRELSARHGVRLAGGDTTASVGTPTARVGTPTAGGGVAINVVAIGRAPLARLKYRSGAREGDIVAVNGPLGESAAGLADILAGRPDTPLARVHRNPVAQVDEGEWLGGREEVRSMIDLSDGLASDLLHVLRASGNRAGGNGSGGGCCDGGGDGGGGGNGGGGLCAEIELTALPTPVSHELAVTGGEDYKLLLTVAPEGFARLADDYLARFGVPLYAVGRIVAGRPRTDRPRIVWLEGGVPVVREWRGFVHF